MSVQNYNTENFNKTFMEEKKSGIVDFYAPWCIDCKRIGPVYSALSEEYSDITFAQINIDDEPELAKEYKVTSIPTMFYFKDGKMVGTIVLPDSKAKVENFIKENM